MERYTLVPSNSFRQDKAREILSELFTLESSDRIKYVELPHYQAVLIFALSSDEDPSYTPAVSDLLQVLPMVKEYNKIVVSYSGGYVHIAIAEADKLLFCNSFPAKEFITAQYFIFATIKEFQFNPEMSTIYFRERLDFEEIENLLRYFRGVENISVLYNSK